MVRCEENKKCVKNNHKGIECGSRSLLFIGYLVIQFCRHRHEFLRQQQITNNFTLLLFAVNYYVELFNLISSLMFIDYLMSFLVYDSCDML